MPRLYFPTIPTSDQSRGRGARPLTPIINRLDGTQIARNDQNGAHCVSCELLAMRAVLYPINQQRQRAAVSKKGVRPNMQEGDTYSKSTRRATSH
eukprot:scaffold131119_cov34-Tisochrysis_lutea.AAC.2